MYSEARTCKLKLAIPPRFLRKRILHQQCTKNVVVGKALARRIGEGIREGLSSTNSTLIGSMEMGGTARAHLGRYPIPDTDIKFVNFTEADKKGALAQVRLADKRARSLLKRIDNLKGSRKSNENEEPE